MEDNTAWEVEQRMLLLQPDPQSPADKHASSGNTDVTHAETLGFNYYHPYLKLPNFRFIFETIHLHKYTKGAGGG